MRHSLDDFFITLGWVAGLFAAISVVYLIGWR